MEKNRTDYQREYREKNREKIRLYRKERLLISRKLDNAHYARTKDKHREIWACRKYGISLDKYKELERQNNCDICGREEETVDKNGKVKRLAIDHDHATGSVRGLLCQRCNQAIGLMREDTLLLERAIIYIKYART